MLLGPISFSGDAVDSASWSIGDSVLDEISSQMSVRLGRSYAQEETHAPGFQNSYSLMNTLVEDGIMNRLQTTLANSYRYRGPGKRRVSLTYAAPGGQVHQGDSGHSVGFLCPGLSWFLVGG